MNAVDSNRRSVLKHPRFDRRCYRHQSWCYRPALKAMKRQVLMLGVVLIVMTKVVCNKVQKGQ